MNDLSEMEKAKVISATIKETQAIAHAYGINESRHFEALVEAYQKGMEYAANYIKEAS